MHSSMLGRRMLALAAVATTVVSAFAGIALGSTASVAKGPEKYSIGLFGDMPYNAQGKADYPFLLDDINKSDVQFSIFDGDLKAGGDGPCADSLYTTAIANFNKLEDPLVWVPGDNDWTDCWGRYGPGTQPYSDPLERLAHERDLFASTDHSLGKHTLGLTRESSEGGQYALYSENVRWSLGPVVYLGLDVQGSNDNYPYHDTDAENPTAPVRSDAEIQRMRDEEIARKAANLHWLAEGFAYAKQVGAKGVLIDWQADPNFNNEQHLTNPHDGDAYPDYVNALRTETIAFPGQVALVHGDSHYFKVDKPLTLQSGKVLGNFTPRRDLRRGQHGLGAGLDRRARSQPVPVRADDRRGDRDVLARGVARRGRPPLRAGSGGLRAALAGEVDEVGGAVGAQVVDECPLVLLAGEERLPGGEVLRAMEVPVRDDWDPRLGDPPEELRAVDELCPVDVRTQRLPSGGPAGGGAMRRRCGRDRVRMRRDQRRAVVTRCLERGHEPVVDGDERAQTDRDGVGSVARVAVVVGELRPGNDEKVVLRAGAPRFLRDLREVGRQPRGREVAALAARGSPRVVAPDDVVGDTEDVEAMTAVEVDELADREQPIAPARVRVELAEQWRGFHRGGSPF